MTDNSVRWQVLNDRLGDTHMYSQHLGRRLRPGIESQQRPEDWESWASLVCRV